MPRDTRNSLHIYYIKDGKEVHKIRYPKSVCGRKTNWRDFSINMAYDLYNEAWTEVCKCFKVLVVDDLPTTVRFAWDVIPIPSLPEDSAEREEIEKSDMYATYKELFVESHIRECTESMFSDAYSALKRACSKDYGTERTHRRETYDEYKTYFDLNYLFYDMLGNQEANLEYFGAWILRDGSYITVDTAQHNRLLKEYMDLNEWDIERYWVKISLGTVYVHNRMTDAQIKTLNKFYKQHSNVLSEQNIEEW